MNHVATRAALACASVLPVAAVSRPKTRALAVAALVGALAAGVFLGDEVRAAPVTYAFSATGTPSGGPRVGGTPFVDPSLFAGLPVSGSFVYDNSALFFATNPIGSSSYRGFTPQSVSGFVTALNSLSGQTGARTFSDVAGSVEVGNDHSPGGAFDFLQYVFDPFTNPSGLAQNLSSSGFNINGFSLVNVRFLFNEGIDTPVDFLSSQDLPATPPAFAGRMVFDFALPGETQASAFVFIGNLTITPLTAVPEPEITAMLAAGFGLLGFAARRKRALR